MGLALEGCSIKGEGGEALGNIGGDSTETYCVVFSLFLRQNVRIPICDLYFLKPVREEMHGRGGRGNVTSFHFQML